MDKGGAKAERGYPRPTRGWISLVYYYKSTLIFKEKIKRQSE